MLQVPRRLSVFVLILGYLIVSAASAGADGVQAPSAAASGDFAGLVDIGGRRLYLECRGTGSPTVILEAGYRGAAGVWSVPSPEVPQPPVMSAVAGFTHVCAYDRPGTLAENLDGDLVFSRSAPVPQPRTAPDVVADLHALLHTAGVPGPYVLAGHSLGGLFVRLYASTYPDEVVGLALVDALSEGLEAQLTPQEWAAYVQSTFAMLTPDWAANLGVTSAMPTEAELAAIERLDFAAVADTMRRAAAARPLRPLPLVVLSKGRSFDVPDEYLGFSLDALDTAWASAQDDLPALVPNARHMIASRSGHNIQQDQPALVTEAIRQVVAGVRDLDTWYDLSSCCGT